MDRQENEQVEFYNCNISLVLHLIINSLIIFLFLFFICVGIIVSSSSSVVVFLPK